MKVNLFMRFNLVVKVNFDMKVNLVMKIHERQDEFQVKNHFDRKVACRTGRAWWRGGRGGGAAGGRERGGGSTRDGSLWGSVAVTGFQALSTLDQSEGTRIFALIKEEFVFVGSKRTWPQ